MSIRKNLVAYVALFIALGGTSYAAIRLPADSVGTKQLRNGAVTGPKIRAHSLTARVFARGTLPSGRLRTTVVSTTSPPPVFVCSQTPCAAPSPGMPYDWQTFCGSGQQVVGGGYQIEHNAMNRAADLVVLSAPIKHGVVPTGNGGSFSEGTSDGWAVAVEPVDPSNPAPLDPFTVYAICAPAG